MTRTVDGLEVIQRLGQQYEAALKAAGLAPERRDDRRDSHADRYREPARDVHARGPRAGDTRHRA